MANWKTLKRRKQRLRARNRVYGPHQLMDLATLDAIMRDTLVPAVEEMFARESILMRYLERGGSGGDTSYYRTVPHSIQIPLKTA